MKRLLSIRAKFVLAFLIASILPISIISIIFITTNIKVRMGTIGNQHTLLSRDVIDKLDRAFFSNIKNVEAWSGLEVMQDIITQDADGRIASVLGSIKKSYGIYSEILCIDEAGNIVASTGVIDEGLSNVSNKVWFKAAYSGQLYSGDLVDSDLAGGLVVFFSSPVSAVYDSTQNIGVVAAAYNWSEIYNITSGVQVNKAGQDENGFVLLMNADGKLVSAPGFEIANDSLLNRDLLKEGLIAAFKAKSSQEGYIKETVKEKSFLIGFAPSKGYRDFKGSGWSAFVFQNTDEVFQVIQKGTRELIIIVIILGVISSFLGYMGARYLSKPLLQLTSVTKKITETGDPSHAQSININTGDELEDLADSIKEMGLSLGKLLANKDHLVTNINESIQTLSASSAQVTAISAELATGSQEQLAAVTESVTTTQEISATAQEIAKTASHVLESSELARGACIEGNTAMDEAVEGFQELTQSMGMVMEEMDYLEISAKQIGGILDIIKEISTQIDILALNAAVEAGIAGKHGMRFGVVAREVRRLSGIASESYGQIQKTISGIQKSTATMAELTERSKEASHKGEQLIRDAKGSMERIVLAVEETSEAAKIIDLSTSQQTSALEQMGSSITEVGDVAKLVADSARNTETSMGDLSKLVNTLNELLEN